jgi:hypothetical protein
MLFSFTFYINLILSNPFLNKDNYITFLIYNAKISDNNAESGKVPRMLAALPRCFNFYFLLLTLPKPLFQNTCSFIFFFLHLFFSMHVFKIIYCYYVLFLYNCLKNKCMENK